MWVCQVINNHNVDAHHPSCRHCSWSMRGGLRGSGCCKANGDYNYKVYSLISAPLQSELVTVWWYCGTTCRYSCTRPCGCDWRHAKPQISRCRPIEKKVDKKKHRRQSLAQAPCPTSAQVCLCLCYCLWPWQCLGMVWKQVKLTQRVICWKHAATHRLARHCMKHLLQSLMSPSPRQ